MTKTSRHRSIKEIKRKAQDDGLISRRTIKTFKSFGRTKGFIFHFRDKNLGETMPLLDQPECAQSARKQFSKCLAGLRLYYPIIFILTKLLVELAALTYNN